MKRRNFITVIGSGIASGILIPGPCLSFDAEAANNTTSFITHTRKPKTVVLIGDSIRMAYQPYVKAELEGKVIIVGPEENCRHSGVILQNLNKWVIDLKPDMVHMNAGLHEIFRDKDGGNRQISIEKYTSNLEGIFGTLVTAGVKLIWSATTPVIDEWYFKERGYVCRVDEDVVNYNKAASIVLERYKIQVLDLYSFCKSQPKETIYYKDGVHFSPEGSLLQGKLISKFILKNL